MYLIKQKNKARYHGKLHPISVIVFIFYLFKVNCTKDFYNRTEKRAN